MCRSFSLCLSVAPLHTQSSLISWWCPMMSEALAAAIMKKYHWAAITNIICFLLSLFLFLFKWIFLDLSCAAVAASSGCLYIIRARNSLMRTTTTQRISERAFDGLNNLRILNLENNKITMLDGATFSGVPAVTTLNLNNNLLETLTYQNVLPIMDNLVNNTSSVLSISGECCCCYLHILCINYTTF